jgi:pimeloyl-ACP methyl ester carboxylesterase
VSETQAEQDPRVTGPVLVRHEVRMVHGYRRAFRIAGSGPLLLLVHGIGDSGATWSAVLPALARTHTVLAPDLLGHGGSDKPRADYSVGGFANGLRDLMLLLGHERATLVGHSLGGGVALQFAYQYPERCERLVLVASGGLGTEVTPVLRLAALPGASVAIGASCHAPVRGPVLALARLLGRLGLVEPADVEEAASVWAGLSDPSTRAAFLRTLRSVVDVRGQAVTSRDRLYLTRAVPTLMLWGARDPVLPVAHAAAAAASLPDVELRVLARAGHVPHHTDPEQFVRVVLDFVARTRPARHDADAWRALLTAGGPVPVSPG